MKIRNLLLASVAIFSLAACQPAHREAPHLKRAKVQARHFSDGRYGYQDTTGAWFFYTATSGSPAPGLGQGVWSPGVAPAEFEIMNAADVDIEIAEGPNGAPMSESQASSYEASAEAEGGGMSESSSGPSDSSPSVDSSADSGSSGGGDSGGGGGGDGGGGGGGD